MSLTPQEREIVLALINDPPPGSKIAAAKEFGIDLTLNLRQLSMTFDEQLKQLENFDSAVQDLRKSSRA
jgi:hypothetical protein